MPRSASSSTLASLTSVVVVVNPFALSHVLTPPASSSHSQVTAAVRLAASLDSRSLCCTDGSLSYLRRFSNTAWSQGVSYPSRPLDCSSRSLTNSVLLDTVNATSNPKESRVKRTLDDREKQEEEDVQDEEEAEEESED